MAVHLESASVIHSLLLLLKLSHLVANGRALRDRAGHVLAFLRMDSEQSPDPLADAASALDAAGTRFRVPEVVLHLGTVLRRASFVDAFRGMLDQLDMQLQVALTVLSLGSCERARIGAAVLTTLGFDIDRLEGMGARSSVRLGISVALSAKIVIGTYRAMVALAAENLAVAHHALLDELGGVSVVQVPEHHHRRMFGPAEFIELVMVSTAQVEESLSIVQEFAVEVFGVIVDHLDRPSISVHRTNLLGSLAIGVSLVARLQRDQLARMLVTILLDFVRDFEMLLLHPLPVQECHNKAFLHRLNRFAQFHHDLIAVKVGQILDAIHETAGQQRFFVHARRPGAAAALCLRLALLLALARAALLFAAAFLERFDDVLCLTWEVITFQVRHGGPIKRLVREVEIVHVGHRAHDAASLAFQKHVDVPLAQSIVPWSFLVFRLRVEDVVISLQRRTRPNMRRRKAALPHIVQVRNEDFVVHECSESTGPHEMDAVQVRHVDATLVGGWIVFSVFVHVESKEDDVDSIDVLEDDDALAAEGELVGILLVSIPLLHEFTNFQLAIHRGHLSNDDLARIFVRP
mmetsp:Transcript_3872/g.10916  ORF Transcript_3872/g.10916 Transcript_3872/m.10916 type:complete len:576 (+) Transcript_3872:401-2128(+)